MTRTDAPAAPASNVALAVLCGSLSALATIDLITDLGRGMSAFHAGVEAAMIVTGAAAALWLVLRARALYREAGELRERARELAAHLDASRRDAERWRRDAAGLIQGLSAAIDDQLERWGLSPAEKAIALLLLKGLSHKEISALRATSETTVRQQARALYRKAGLSGRTDLAAFFLEDLLGPAPTGAMAQRVP